MTTAVHRETGPDGARRLALDDGTHGRLLPAPPWSWRVADLAGPSPAAWLDEAERWAAAAGVLDLRVEGPQPRFARLTPGAAEQVRPVPVPLADAAATRALGRRVASVLRAGDLLVLSGPLGAGKTTFTQGVGEALEVRGRVTSPTFVLARVHRGRLPLVHVDAYRLRGPDGASSGSLDLDDLDLDAALESSVTVVEWGEGLVERLADAHLAVTFDRARPDAAGHISDMSQDGREDNRSARIQAHGERWSSVPPPKVTGQTRGG